MFERILVPLDGSERAESVLSQIRRMLTYHDAEVLLLQTVSLSMAPGTIDRRSSGSRWARAGTYLESITRRLVSEGMKVTQKVAQGAPTETILRVAGAERTTLIVLSTHGRTGNPRSRLGNVMQRLLKTSLVPVLVMPSFTQMGEEFIPADSRERSFRTILVPIADSELSLQILPSVEAIVETFGSHVILLNVREPGGAGHVSPMRSAFDLLKQKGVPVEPLILRGEPGARILEVAEKRKVDLIALTTHARSGVSRWGMGSVADIVLHGAQVPLLVVTPIRPNSIPRTRSPGVIHANH